MKFDPNFFYGRPASEQAEIAEKMKRRKRARRALAAKLRREALESVGMTRVKGNLGGTSGRLVRTLRRANPRMHRPRSTDQESSITFGRRRWIRRQSLAEWAHRFRCA